MTAGRCAIASSSATVPEATSATLLAAKASEFFRIVSTVTIGRDRPLDTPRAPVATT